MGCELKINESFLLCVNLMVSLGLEIDCMIVEMKGMFNLIVVCVFVVCFISGVCKEILEGIYCLVVRLGISRYLLKVFEIFFM